MLNRKSFSVIFTVSMFLGMFSSAAAQWEWEWDSIEKVELSEQEVEWNNQIRREKFDLVLPVAMRKNKVDMWIHVMRVTVFNDFGRGEFGSSSGVFVFTDRGGDRIERAVLGRRWEGTDLVEESGAYDIIHDPVPRDEQVGGPMTEYDYRFEGLREFVEERDPKRIAVNYRHELGPYPTANPNDSKPYDGISLTDYLLLTEKLGEKYAKRLVSAEYVMMDYIIRKVPSEIKLLKKMRQDEVERVKKAFANIVPGEVNNSEEMLTVFRRRSTGRGQRMDGVRDRVILGGDIIAAPLQGMYAYVLREGETQPPPEIQKLWANYLTIDKILAETIKTGLTAREIKEIYKRKFEEAGIIVRDRQLRGDFTAYSLGFDPEKTHLSVDCHGMMKGARQRKLENYFGPRIGSLGPEWTWDIPLPTNHHFVLEYFFYMPSPTSNEEEDQYLYWWDHEEAIATENGVEYLSPPQKELFLIK